MAVSSAHLRRRLATGTNAVLVTVFVVAIAGFLVDLADRHPLRWDLSSDRVATLAPETIAALGGLDRLGEDVEITAFSAQAKDAEADVRNRMVRDLLRDLQAESGRVNARFVDFDADRLTAEAKGVSRYGTIVVEGHGQRVDLVDRELFKSHGRAPDRQLEFFGESAIARAIHEITADRQPTVYVLTGHGERKLDGGAPSDLGLLRDLLGNQGYRVDELDLLRAREVQGPPKIPADASALLVVGPTAPLTPDEDAAVGEYLARGGAVGTFVDPGGFVAAYLEQAGVTVPTGVVLDTLRVFPFEDRPVLRYGAHAITQDLLDDEILTLVARAAPLAIARGEDRDAVDLLVSSRTSWLERGDERPARFDDGVDERGPLTVATAVRVHGARMLVAGDADVLSDELITDGPGNGTFAVNAVRWLVGDDDRMSLVGRPGATRRLAMSDDQLALVRVIVLLVTPLLALVAGIGVWSARRAR
jgi:hypothetical protein